MDKTRKVGKPSLPSRLVFKLSLKAWAKTTRRKKHACKKCLCPLRALEASTPRRLLLHGT